MAATGPSADFDRIADRYDATRGGLRRGRHVAGEIGPWLRPGVTLEVGVGTGAVALPLREAGHRVVGVDLSAGMLDRAATRLGPSVARADGQALPIRSAAVTNVLFSWVLHLVGDLDAAVAEAARVVQPAGRVVIISRPDARADEITRAMAPVSQLADGRPDTDTALAGAADTAGLAVEHTGWTRYEQFDQSPATAARLIEERVWRHLWDLDQPTWTTTVAPVIAALRALPEAESPRHRTIRHRLTVLGRTGPAGGGR